jgi:cell wall-associated NlpC family hydrolase
MLGDVLVFRRGGGGHVALYVGEDEEAFHVLGGNQADRCASRDSPARGSMQRGGRPTASFRQA